MNEILQLAQAERPREKLVTLGPGHLTDLELLMIILGSGQRGRSVSKLAAELLPIIDQGPLELSPADLEDIPGVGTAKASLILASLEFARRRIRPEGLKIRQPADVLPLLTHLTHHKQEHFVAISLNGAHEVIHSRIITIGLVNFCQIHPREVFADVITDRACALIVAHNHPSGSLDPSEEDRRVTKLIKDAGELLRIKLLDHIIFSKQGHYSFQAAGLI